MGTRPDGEPEIPTYVWGCSKCGERVEAFMGIREYCDAPPAFVHCGELMPRVLMPVHLGYVSEDSYRNLRAPDGTDLSSREKHRAYMRDRGLTTIDDYTDTWKRAQRERAANLAGEDPSRKADIVQAINQLGG